MRFGTCNTCGSDFPILELFSHVYACRAQHDADADEAPLLRAKLAEARALLEEFASRDVFGDTVDLIALDARDVQPADGGHDKRTSQKSAKVQMKANGVIQLRSGALFSVLEPDPSVITLLDVAVSLARQARYTGHTTHQGEYCWAKQPDGVIKMLPRHSGACDFCARDDGYSVAEHSVWVSRVVAPGHEREALMHDAAEAFISDVVSPIKYLPGFERLRELEADVERAVAERFKLQYPWSPEVKAADYEMLCAEVRQLMPWRQAPEAWGEIPTRQISPAAEHARLGLPYREALALFLQRAAELGIS